MAKTRTRGWHTRKHLVETIKATLARNNELGYTQTATLGSLGQIAILRGQAEAGILHEQSPVTLSLLDRRIATGERVVTLLTRSGIFARDELTLEPFDPNEWVIRRPSYEASNDEGLTRRINTVVYSEEASRVALEVFTQNPREYGIPKDW